MSNINDGGAACERSLRDRFAEAAMAKWIDIITARGLSDDAIAALGLSDGAVAWDAVSVIAYKYADAMIAERDKDPTQ